MKEIHGVVARKEEYAMADSDRAVRVTDGPACVFIILADNTGQRTARLTSQEARFIAGQLVRAAGRTEPVKEA